MCIKRHVIYSLIALLITAWSLPADQSGPAPGSATNCPIAFTLSTSKAKGKYLAAVVLTAKYTLPSHQLVWFGTVNSNVVTVDLEDKK